MLSHARSVNPLLLGSRAATADYDVLRRTKKWRRQVSRTKLQKLAKNDSFVWNISSDYDVLRRTTKWRRQVSRIKPQKLAKNDRFVWNISSDYDVLRRTSKWRRQVSRTKIQKLAKNVSEEKNRSWHVHPMRFENVFLVHSSCPSDLLIHHRATPSENLSCLLIASMIDIHSTGGSPCANCLARAEKRPLPTQNQSPLFEKHGNPSEIVPVFV